MVGTIHTPEGIEAKRLELAENVLAAMAASDSRECRNRHSFAATDREKQPRRLRDKHPSAMKEGKAYIGCHKGVAHKLPDAPRKTMTDGRAWKVTDAPT